jgi:hypothetical protein
MISQDARELTARIVNFYRKYENDPNYGIDDDWYDDCDKMIDDEMDKIRDRNV